MADTPYRYRAFISYSHADERWAQWLHHALEGYRVPRRLVGRAGRFGPIPRRLFPVFRDRDELASTSELSGAINEALEQSAHLIVISSPNAAGSRWVNEEVRKFKSLGREDRVLALIVAGEPGAAEHGEALQECFPPALRHPIDAEGRVAAAASEPIAADVRPGRDSRGDALLRLVAGLLGIGYDELRQRERHKRFWQRLREVAAGIAILGVVAGLFHLEGLWRAERARQVQLARYVDLGREELLRERKARAASFLSAAYSGGLDTPALRVLLGQAMPAIDAITGIRVRPDAEAPGVLMWMPDGRRFVTVWHNAKLWDARSGALLHSFGDGDQGLTGGLGLGVSDDGRSLLVEGRRDFSDQPLSVSVYDTGSGALRFHRTGVASADSYGSAFRSFSPDGNRLLLLEGGRRATINDSASGTVLGSLEVEGISSASYDGSGRRIATADDAGQVTIWDAASHRPSLRIATGVKGRNLAFFAPDGRLMLATQTGKLRVYDPANGRLIDAFGGHARSIERVVFSQDGRRLMTSAADGVRVWNAVTGDQLLYGACQQCSLTIRAGLSPDGRRLTSRVDSTRIALWDIDERRQIETLEGHSGLVNSALFSADGRALLTGANDGTVVVWDTTKLQPTLRAQLPHDAPIKPTLAPETYSGRFSPDGSLVVTTGTDGTARLWDAHSGALKRVLRGHTDSVYHAAFSPDGHWLATASDDQTARIWDVGSGAVQAVLTGHKRFVRRVVFSPDGSRLLTVAGTEPMIWNVADGQLLATLGGHQQPAVEGEFSADGSRVVTASVDGCARVFDSRSGALLATLRGHEGVVPFASFVDGGRRVLSAGTDGSLRIWDSGSGGELQLLRPKLAGSGGFRHGVLSHDGGRAMISAWSGEIVVWDWRSGALDRLVGHTVAGYWNEFSPDDRFGLSASNDGSAILWDLATRTALQVFRIPNRINSTWSASFSPDAGRIVTAGEAMPPTAELWDLRREGRSAEAIAAALRCKSPWQVDGERLVSRTPEPEDCAGLLAPAAGAEAVLAEPVSAR